MPTKQDPPAGLFEKLTSVHEGVLKREGDALAPEQQENLRNTLRTRRLVTGFIFLGASALLIGSTYWLLPRLVKSAVSSAQLQLQGEADKVRAAAALLDEEALPGLATQIGALNQNALNVVGAFSLKELDRIANEGARASEALQELRDDLDAAALATEVADLRTSIEPWTPTVDAEGVPGPGPALAGIAALDVPETLEVAGPRALAAALRDLPARLEAIEAADNAIRAGLGDSDSLEEKLREQRRPSGRIRGYTDTNKEEVLELVDSVRIFFRYTDRASLIDDARKLGAVLEQRVVAVDPASQRALERLESVPVEISQVATRLDEAAARLEEASKALNAASQDITPLLDEAAADAAESNGLREAVSDMAETSKTTEQALEILNGAAREIQKSVNTLEEVAVRTRDATAIGTGPVSFVILAIAAMCATLGISAVWRWMRSAEDQRNEIDTHVNAMIVSQITGSLLDADIEPESALAIIGLIDRHLHSPKGKGGRTVPLPAGRTLEEILQMLKEMAKR